MENAEYKTNQYEQVDVDYYVAEAKRARSEYLTQIVSDASGKVRNALKSASLNQLKVAAMSKTLSN